MSLVAVTPVGSGEPDSSAASTPTFSEPMGVHADQFHVVAPDDRVQRPTAYIAGDPLNDAQWALSHRHLLWCQSGSPYSSNQYASLPRLLTARSRRSAAVRVFVVVTMSSSSPVSIRVSGWGAEGWPSRLVCVMTLGG